MRRTKHYPFAGGVDLVTSPLKLKPGLLIGASNYEIASTTSSGYRRIDGYERFDGNTKPSEAVYWLVSFDAGTVAILEDDVLGEVSGTGAQTINMVALADAVLTSGAWDGTGVGYVAVGFDSTTGLINASNLLDDATLYRNTTLTATANGVPVQDGASTDALDTTYARAAIEHARGLISTVTGSGDIRGVWVYKGVTYAFRDNVGGTAGQMYKETATGWTLVSLGYEIAFTGGSQKGSGDDGVEVADTITGATSTETAIVTGVAITSGTWSAGTAAGWIYVQAAPSGAFQAENLDVGADLNIATIAGDFTTNALPLAGRYEFINENFSGSASSRKMYGCNGVGSAFQFDGTDFMFIHTGMTTDTPIHITEHKKHLFLAFPNGSVQHSSITVPLEWSVITGAAEIGTGDEITGFVTLPNDALGIFNRNRTYILYGTAVAGSNPWNLVNFSDEAGAIEWTPQRMGWPMYFDDRGLTRLDAVQAYGDFKSAVFSQKIEPLLKSKKSLVIGTTRVRDKNQYRIWFSDKTAVFASFDGNKLSGFMPEEYPVKVVVSCSSEDSSGNEVLFFGSTDGYIYQMDKGTSFDGAAVEAFIRPAFNHLDSPQHNKRFFKMVAEIDATDSFTLSHTPDFSYAEKDDITQDLTVSSGGGFLNIDDWNEFLWSEQSTDNPEAYISGSGLNYGSLFFTDLTYEAPHILHGIILHYSVRGLAR